MSFPLHRMIELAASGPVARVVVAGTQGSVPRDVGASMLVTADGLDGTIGGGALEFEAIERARGLLAGGRDLLERKPLGPALGQCCGGAVTVLTEVWDAKRLAEVEGEIVVRALPGTKGEMPLSVRRALSKARSTGAEVLGMIEGWMVEPVAKPTREIWVWGAGHVGRAIVNVLSPMPDLKIRWADSPRARFPDDMPESVEELIAENPADLVSLAPAHAEHLVLTYSHALDLEICHRVLSGAFGHLGLIGSATKRARFRSRLKALGHSQEQINRMDCPIGDPSLGKHPQEIAVGVAAEIIKSAAGEDRDERRTAS